MLRVVYETRSLDDLISKPVCRAECLPASEVDVAASTVRGVLVKIIECEQHRANRHYKTTPAMRSRERRSYADLKRLLYRHYRRSAWKLTVHLVVDQFIQELEWEEVLKQAGGYRTHPFTHHWHQFKKQYDHALRWSPATLRMFARLEKQSWLLPYMEEDNKT